MNAWEGGGRSRIQELIASFSRYYLLGAIPVTVFAAVYARDGKDHDAEVTELVTTIEIERNQDAEVGLIYEARKQYEQAVAQGSGDGRIALASMTGRPVIS